MDMLGNQKMRQLITDYYQSTDEPRLVSRAVLKARTKERLLSIDMMDGSEAILPSMWDKLKYVSFCSCCLLLLVLFYRLFLFVFVERGNVGKNMML